jgi:membrane fusion protein (multidrug efflux system)
VRYLIAVLVCIVALGALGAVKTTQIAALVAAGHRAKEQGPPPETIATAVAKEEVWEDTVTDVGTVTSAKAVTLSNDAPGTVIRIHFDSGQEVKRGDLLVELESDVEQAQLAAAATRTRLARTQFGRTSQLDAVGAVTESALDTDRTTLRSNRQDADALAAQIRRKQIRAPFDGRLGIRAVNLGQYLPSGTAVTVLETTDQLFVDFSLPQELLPELATGMRVRIALAADGGAPREGAIHAIQPAVDDATRTVKVRATVPSTDGALRPGMFVRATVLLPHEQHVVVVPAPAVVHAPYGDSVFLVEDKPAGAPGMRTTRGAGGEEKPVQVVRQQFVRTGETRGDFVAVLQGVKPGERVVTAGAFKLRNGAPVVTNDTLQAKPELAPTPANR